MATQKQNIDALEMALRKSALAKRKRTGNAATEVNLCEPAHSIIKKLGGVREVSRFIGISAAGVTRWQTPVNKRQGKRATKGCGGVIPEARRAQLITMATDRMVRLTKKEFEK
jgi:hypothetical protein